MQADSLYQVPDPNRANNTLAADRPARRQPACAHARQARHRLVHGRRPGPLLPGHRAGRRLAGRLGCERGVVRRCAVYVSQGTLPTPYNYQDDSAIPNQPNQTAVVPQVLDRRDLLHPGPQRLGRRRHSRLYADGHAEQCLDVSGLSPTSGGNAGNVTVEIDGTNFTPTATATLTLGGIDHHRRRRSIS